MSIYLLVAVVILCVVAMVKVSDRAIYTVLDIQKASAAERKYLLDRIQTGSAEEAARLNAEPTIKEKPPPARANFGTAYGLKVDQNLTKEEIEQCKN
jgi:hypothetical protein